LAINTSLEDLHIMKKLIVGVLASMTMLASSTVFAQQNSIGDAFPPMPVPPALPGLGLDEEPFMINGKAMCGSLLQMDEMLNSVGEIVIVKMIAVRAAGPIQFPGNPAPAVMTFNLESGTWSLIENLAPDVYCMTASGFGLTPFAGGGQKINYKN